MSNSNSNNPDDSKWTMRDFVTSMETALPRFARMQGAYPFEEDEPYKHVLKGAYQPGATLDKYDSQTGDNQQQQSRMAGQSYSSSSSFERNTYDTSGPGSGSAFGSGKGDLPPKIPSNVTASYTDTLPPNLKHIPDGTQQTIKTETCVHDAQKVIPGTMTTVTQGVTRDGKPAQIVQPGESIRIRGDDKVRESTSERTLHKVDYRVHEHSSTPGYIVQEKPVYVVKEKPVFIERPVYIEKAVDKPYLIEKTIDRPVFVEKIVEKPIVIEKTIDRPVYIVHETPGVVVGREVNIKDTTEKLSRAELEAFAKKQGLVYDSTSKTFIAPPQLVHDAEELKRRTEVNVHPVTTTTTTTTSSNLRGSRASESAPLRSGSISTSGWTAGEESGVFYDRFGHRLQQISESEYRRLRDQGFGGTFVDASGHKFVSTGSRAFANEPKFEEKDDRGFFARLFGWGKKKEPVHPTTATFYSNQPYFQQQQMGAAGAGGMSFGSGAPQFQQSYSGSSSGGSAYRREEPQIQRMQETTVSRPWFFGDGVSRSSKYADTLRDPTFLPAGGLLENSSSSAAEHYYRFGTTATVDHPTDPIQLDTVIKSQKEHPLVHGELTAQQRMQLQREQQMQREQMQFRQQQQMQQSRQGGQFDPNSRNWISGQSASDDWHLQNLYVQSTGEIVAPSTPHASLTELGQVLNTAHRANTPAGEPTAPGATVERVARGAEQAVDDAVDGAKRFVSKTVDGAVDLADKAIDKAHEGVHSMKQSIAETKVDRGLSPGVVSTAASSNAPSASAIAADDAYWWKS